MNVYVKNFSTLKIKIRVAQSLPFWGMPNDCGEHNEASELLIMFYSWIWILGTF